jgi:hypothetical protein
MTAVTTPVATMTLTKTTPASPASSTTTSADATG